jgi:hypothetical protein
MDQLHVIWELIRGALSEKLASATIMDLWFNTLELAAISDTTAVIITDSSIKKKIIINRYSDTLKQVFEETLGFPVEVCILSDEKNALDREQLQNDVGGGMTGDVLICKYSSEHDTIAYRPKLVLTYSDPQTPDDLGLNTNKAYWIKNKDSGQYLTVMQNQWKSGSNVGVINSSLNPFSNSISALQKSNMYWQIEYIGNGEYRLIPFNTRDMRLDVISSSNTNGANVGIYSNDGYDSSIWRIKKMELIISQFFRKLLITLKVLGLLEQM